MSSLNALFNSSLVGRFLNWKQGDEEEIWRNKALEVLLKKVNRAHQQENLKLALGRKKENTPCVTLDRSKDGRLQVMHRKMLPHVMYCRIFRWPDLQSQHELRSVSSCKWPAHQREMAEICINPYHYSRVDHSNYPPVVCARNNTNEFTNASPPPYSPMSSSSQYSPQHQSPTSFPAPAHQQDPYSYFTNQPMLQNSSQSNSSINYPNSQVEPSGWFPASNSLFGNSSNVEPQPLQPTRSNPWVRSSPFPGYSAIDPGTMSTPMDTQDGNQPKAADQLHWCQIFYFELSQRVGDPFKSNAPNITVNGYTNPESSDVFSLGWLSHLGRSKPIEQVRDCIGKGITLENDGAHIYIHNNSEHSVFFFSKVCNIENQLNQHTVVKVEPGRKEKMFDFKIFEDLLHEAKESQDPFDQLNSLKGHLNIYVSFVKGWGSIYKRQNVTSTPCWIDIVIMKKEKCRDLHDLYLSQVGPRIGPTSTS